MQEITFIKKNETKWKAAEAFLNAQIQLTPDELAGYYTDIISDLSYAKSFYPKSQIVKYLNSLSSKLHRQIYKTKKEDRKRFWSFWTTEVPLAIKRCHKELLISLIVFLIAISIGTISSYLDPEYSRLILGDYYVDMTLDNIEKGDPMGVYKDENYNRMFFGIGSNNLRVGLISFVLGFIGSVFAGFILFTNGVMVGAFQTFFIQQGLFWTSFSTIFIHGALELSAIVLIAGAGMVIGNAWWFPGTYSRIDSLMKKGKDSVMLVIAILPIIVLAAFLESYVTHLYQYLPDFVRLMIIVLSFAYIIWYFILLPNKLSKKQSIHG